MSSVDIIFYDSRAGKTSVHKMTTGVPQGGSLSSALFDMGIAPSIRRAQLALPTASIYLIADDNMVVGPTTTDSKNVIYGLSTLYTDAQRDLALASDLHCIPSTHGFLVGGTPIGSDVYMIEHINTTVDAIIDEMLQLETYLHGPNGRMRIRVQTIFKMIQHCSAQQLTYLLRTCPPHVTLHAAIANTIHRIMDCVHLLPRLPCELSSIVSSFLSDWEAMASLTQKLRVRLHLCCIHDLLWPYDAQRCSYSWYF